jgi:glutamate-5-semialdehyde dehydrogenase
MWLSDDGLNIGIRRVPLGVIGIIYESRPNVTVDAATLCLKTGNSVILKGGSDAIHSNRALVIAIKEALKATGYSTDTVQLIDSTDRSATLDLLKENKTVDCIIPRGGASLIQFVVNESKVPIIETGTGICHIYVDEHYPHDKAIEIILNAKTQKPGACNAVETVLIHESEVKSLLPKLCTALFDNHVKLHLSSNLVPYLQRPDIPYEIATTEDFQTEYLDYELTIASVSNTEQATFHIETYGTHHSDAILTKNYDHAQFFLDNVDSAAVYVNASTRFTDGNAFGYGAEIGISTQKLHARGPMGLEALTTIKYVIYGNDQSRN